MTVIAHQIGCSGVRAGDDERVGAHDVALKAGRVQPVDVLLRRHQHLAAPFTTHTTCTVLSVMSH